MGPQRQVTAEDRRSFGEQLGGIPLASDLEQIGGAVNGVAIVETVGHQWVVRIHRPWVTAERLRFQHSLMGFLRQRGLPVPEVLAKPDGDTVFRASDRLAELMEYIPHDGCADTWERAASAFEMLAKLHFAMSQYNDGTQGIEPKVSSYATPEDALSMLSDTDSRFSSSARVDCIAEIHDVRNKTRRMLEDMEAEWRSWMMHLPRQLVHGDYGWTNVLMKGDKVVGIVDFDFAARRERVFDVAYALYWLLDRLNGFRDMTHCLSLLAAYSRGSEEPLTEVETRAIVYEMARVPLYWIAEAGCTPDPMSQIRAYSRHIPTARGLWDSRESISHALAGLAHATG